MTEHVVPQKSYYRIFMALILLLVISIAVSYVHLGEWNVVAAVSIAVIKAVLIILYFMHVRHSSHLVWVFVGAGFFWLGIMFALTFSDYLTRGWLPSPTGWD